MSLIKKQLGPITYWQKGEQPTLLICSGTHGDEWSVIEPLTEYVFNNENNFPDFIFIPKVSPSAVAKKTRFNGNNLDINRNFFDQSDDDEVQANLEIINSFDFQKILSFHEDTGYEEFYLYDSHKIESELWQKFVKQVNEIGLDVLNGIDDPDDPVLGVVIKDGYFTTSGFDFSNSNSGTLSEYLAKKPNDIRYFTFEVPTQSSLRQKKELINLIFSTL
jgi:hypothetical protein